MQRPCPATSDPHIARLARPRQRRGLGKAQHVVERQVGGQLACEALSRVLPGHRDEDGARLGAERRGDHERPDRRRHSQGEVLTRLQRGGHLRIAG
jgi:hypothetical protein